MDGKNNGKPYFLMDDLGIKPTIFGNIPILSSTFRTSGKKKFTSYVPVPTRGWQQAPGFVQMGFFMDTVGKLRACKNPLNGIFKMGFLNLKQGAF